MPYKLTRLAQRVREESLPTLAREAMLRIAKRIRLARFQAQVKRVPEVQYHPVGYYKPRLKEVDGAARAAIVNFADCVLRGEFPLLGYGNPALGFPPDWNVDWVSGKSWPSAPSELLAVVRHDGSDVKAPWELSRLQCLPVLAKAHLLTKDEKYRSAARDLLEDWIDRNPVDIGVNWTLAMETALRGVSMCLLLELLWPLRDDEQAWLRKVTCSLWHHLLFIEAHNEFSHLIRSNHYLSNIVGMTTLSASLQGRGMSKRFKRYAQAVQQEILQQTYEDGGDYEASTGYHVLVSQMFLHSYLIQKARGLAIDARFEQRLQAMFAWMAALADAKGLVPHIGDCDDGRVELTLDDIRQTSLPAEQRHSLRLESHIGMGAYIFGQPLGGAPGDAVWFDGYPNATSPATKRRVQLLTDSGLVVARSGDAEVIFAALPNGIHGRGSHTHCDKLSFVLRLNDAEVFCDSGTRCYTRNAELRNRDRGTTAHSVVMVDGQQQNSISNDSNQLFRSGDEASVSPISVKQTEGEIVLAASHKGYARFGVHCQRTLRLRQDELVITDELQGDGSHQIDLLFQLAPEWSATAEQARGPCVRCAIKGERPLVLTCEGGRSLSLEVEAREISRAYGSFLHSARVHVQLEETLPVSVVTRIQW